MKKLKKRIRKNNKKMKRFIEENGIDMRGVIVEPSEHLVDYTVEYQKDGTKKMVPVYTNTRIRGGKYKQKKHVQILK